MLPWWLQHPTPCRSCSLPRQESTGLTSKPNPGASQKNFNLGWILGTVMWDPADQNWQRCRGSFMRPYVLLDHVGQLLLQRMCRANPLGVCFFLPPWIFFFQVPCLYKGLTLGRESEWLILSFSHCFPGIWFCPGACKFGWIKSDPI